MRFAQDSTSGINVIRAYGNGELRVNENVYRGAVILSAATVIADANIHNLDDLIAIDVGRTLALEPELVLLGTGDPLREMREAALKENIVTDSEIRKAQKLNG